MAVDGIYQEESKIMIPKGISDCRFAEKEIGFGTMVKSVDRNVSTEYLHDLNFSIAYIELQEIGL